MNSRKLINRIAENWAAKALSVAIALLLFVFHRMNTLATRPLSVPLLVQTDAELVPASLYPRNVRVILRGDDNGIKSIADNDITAYVDLSRYKTKGWHRSPVQIRKEGTALGVEPLEITVNPLEISVLLDLNVSKTVPLLVDIQGRPASGFELMDHSLSSRDVTVSGPQDILESVTELRTEHVDLQGRTGDFSTVVNIINTNSFINMRGNGIVEFKGIIRPAIRVRNIEGIPIALRNLNPDFMAFTGGVTGSIGLEGDQNSLFAFSPKEGFFSVDCSGLAGPGTYALPVEVDLPGGFILIRQEPVELSLSVTVRVRE